MSLWCITDQYTELSDRTFDTFLTHLKSTVSGKNIYVFVADYSATFEKKSRNIFLRY